MSSVARHHRAIFGRIDIAADGIEVGDNLPLQVPTAAICLVETLQLRLDGFKAMERKIGVANDLAEIPNRADLAPKGYDVLDE